MEYIVMKRHHQVCSGFAYNQDRWYEKAFFHEPCFERQRHVHETQGSVETAGHKPHTHRFAEVSGEAIPYGSGHVHKIKFRTDFVDNHYHEFSGETGGAIPVGDRHVHFLKSVTTLDDGHRHPFRLSTFMEELI